jgi:homocysteine S-methyltransferase
VLLSDGGLETTLIHLHGLDLPCFAAFPLVESPEGRAALTRYLEPYLELARRRGVGFLLGAPTWRANPAWGAELGYSPEALAEANRRAVAFAAETREREDAPGRPVVLSGELGPAADAYSPEARMSADEAAAFHSWQARVLADAGVDMLTALTVAYAEEAAGMVRAATEAGLPVAASFTVEVDGRLPSGQPLAEAIDQVDSETVAAAAYFMVNCAHPTHFEHVLDGPGPWHRLLGVRANASTRSHAELDASPELDDGDPDDLAARYVELRRRLPHLTVFGGCCGTDHRHVERIAAALL